MKRFFFAVMLITGSLIAILGYERIVVEKTIGPSALASLCLVGLVFLASLLSFTRYDTRHREMINRIWMIGLSTSLSYFAFDLIAGFILIKPLSPALASDEYRHHKLIPNTYSRIEQRDFTYVQRVNSLGFRGEDVTQAKPAGTFRILMLGDSFTMGKGVEDTQTFSVLLNAALNDRVKTCGGPSIQVLNGGTDSYSPLLSLIQLRRDLLPLQPDLIVFNLDVSDLVQEQTYRHLAVRAADGTIVGVPGHQQTRETLTDKLRTWVDHRLFFTRALLTYTNKFLGYRDLNGTDAITLASAEITAHTLVGDTVARDQQWRDIFESIAAMQTLSDSNRARFFLSVYPWPHQYSDSAWIPGRYTFMSKDARPSDASMNTIREQATLRHIPLLDTYSAFRAYRGSDPLYFSYDMHWTPAGQRVMAKGLEELLMAQMRDTWCGGK